MMSQPGNQAIEIQILSSVSRSKSNQPTKFSDSIEYKRKNVFLKKSITKHGEEVIPRLFSKKIKFEHISGLIV